MDDLTPSSQDAIKAALTCNWERAIKINLELYALDPKHIDTLNRLGYAYLQIHDFCEAEKTFQKVIVIDKYNIIAAKNLKKIASLKNSNTHHTVSVHISPMKFIEEPGISKTVTCINTAPYSILSTVSAGQEILLSIKKRSVEIRTTAKIYLGVLPDDLSHKIIVTLKNKSTYSACIQHVGKNCLAILLKEQKLNG